MNEEILPRNKVVRNILLWNVIPSPKLPKVVVFVIIALYSNWYAFKCYKSLKIQYLFQDRKTKPLHSSSHRTFLWYPCLLVCEIPTWQNKQTINLIYRQACAGKTSLIYYKLVSKVRFDGCLFVSFLSVQHIVLWQLGWMLHPPLLLCDQLVNSWNLIILNYNYEVHEDFEQ